MKIKIRILFLSFLIILCFSSCQKQVKEEKDLGVNISSDKLDKNTKYYEININRPVVYGMKDKEQEKAINKTISQSSIEIAKDWEKNQKKNLTPQKYSLDYDYKINRDDDRILSFDVQSSIFMGGAHGDFNTFSYNVDKKEGRLLNLSDFFKKDSNYQDILKEILESQRKKNPDQFFEDAILDPNQALFKVTKEGFLFYFNPYSVGPYSSGIIEFEILKEELKNILNEKYFNL